MIWSELKAEFDKIYNSDSLCIEVQEKIENGTLTYAKANEYAIKIGEKMAKFLNDNNALPEGISYEEAKSILTDSLGYSYKLASNAACAAQKKVNDDAEIGLNAVSPKYQKDRIDGLAKEISSKGYANIKNSVDDQIVNFTQSAVDDTVSVNAYFQAHSGLSPKIKRIAEFRCCKWCSNLAGTYDYPAPNDVYRRHSNCRCTTEFVAGKKKQDIWSKKIIHDGSKTAKLRKESPISSKVRFKTQEMPRDEYIKAVSLWDKYEEVKIHYEGGKERLYEELDNNLTYEEKMSATINKNVGNYRYTALHKGHNQYKIIKEVPLDPIEKMFKEEYGELYEQLFG